MHYADEGKPAEDKTYNAKALRRGCERYEKVMDYVNEFIFLNAELPYMWYLSVGVRWSFIKSYFWYHALFLHTQFLVSESNF